MFTSRAKKTQTAKNNFYGFQITNVTRQLYFSMSFQWIFWGWEWQKDPMF